jgi:hypothetical protein
MQQTKLCPTSLKNSGLSGSCIMSLNNYSMTFYHPRLKYSYIDQESMQVPIRHYLIKQRQNATRTDTSKISIPLCEEDVSIETKRKIFSIIRNKAYIEVSEEEWMHQNIY